jgi:hypothetical protein
MMAQTKEFKVEFVQYMPKVFNQGVLYVSMEYSLVIHLCVCGCGEKVATPLSPEDWKLYYDGDAISLSPSIGNWDFQCQSHYWIKMNKVISASKRYKEEDNSWKSKDDKLKPPITTITHKLKSQFKKHKRKKK